MLVVQNRRVNKQYVIGGSGIFDFLIITFTGNVAKQLASSTAKEVGKAALDAGKTVAVDAGKKIIEKVMQPKTTKKKIDDIVSKYVDSQTKGSAVAIQDLVKRINGSGLKKV